MECACGMVVAVERAFNQREGEVGAPTRLGKQPGFPLPKATPNGGSFFTTRDHDIAVGITNRAGFLLLKSRVKRLQDNDNDRFSECGSLSSNGLENTEQIPTIQ